VALNGRHIPSQLANSAQNLFRALNRGFLDSVDIAGKKALVDADVLYNFGGFNVD